MNLDVCLQNIEGGEEIAIANRPSDFVSSIHVYIHLYFCLRSGTKLCFYLSTKFALTDISNLQ